MKIEQHLLVSIYVLIYVPVDQRPNIQNDKQEMTNLMKFNPLYKMYLSNLSWIWYYIFAINHKQIERLDVYSHPIERSFDTVSVRDCRSITDLGMIVSFGVFVSGVKPIINFFKVFY